MRLNGFIISISFIYLLYTCMLSSLIFLRSMFIGLKARHASDSY